MHFIVKLRHGCEGINVAVAVELRRGRLSLPVSKITTTYSVRRAANIDGDQVAAQHHREQIRWRG